MEYTIVNKIGSNIVLRIDGKDGNVPPAGVKFDDQKSWESFRKNKVVAALIKRGELQPVAA